MTLHLFAVLKEYFPSKIIILTNELETINDVKNHLIELNPDAVDILNACRFAIGSKLVTLNESINENSEISVIPPSSGG